MGLLTRISYRERFVDIEEIEKIQREINSLKSAIKNLKRMDVPVLEDLLKLLGLLINLKNDAEWIEWQNKMADISSHPQLKKELFEKEMRAINFGRNSWRLLRYLMIKLTAR